MKRILLCLSLLAAFTVSTSGAYRAFEQVTVAGSAIGFTASNLTASGGHPQAQYAECRVRTAQISYRIDGGTPTTTVGTLLNPGDILTVTGIDALLNFLAIRVTSTSGQLDCVYSEDTLAPILRPGTVSVDAIGTSVTPGTAAANLGKAEDAASVSGDTGVFLLGIRKDAAAQTTNADGDYTQLSVDAYGALFSRSDHPNRISCLVAVSTATSIQAVGGSCIAPGAGLSLYITDIEFSTSASGIAADAFPTLKSGTGGTCGTATAVVWQALSAAAGVFISNSTIPIKLPANNELCWITSTAGSKTLQVRGFIAP